MLQKKLALLLFALLAGIIVAFGGNIASADSSSDSVTTTVDGNTVELLFHDISEAEQAAAIRYWTPEKMAQAVPMDLPQPEIDSAGTPVPTGPETAIVGSLPSSFAPRGEEAYYYRGGFRQEGGEINYSRWCINCSAATNYYPYWTIGKLYFNVPSGGLASCSASIVPSKNGRGSVVTAGHCVYSPGSGWHSNVVFHPSYRNGSPYGSYALPTLWTLTNWAYNGDYGDDVGMGCPSSNLSGTFGSLGLRWNASATQYTYTFGYPGNISGGNYLIVCTDTTSASGSNLIKMGCDMTYGASGGPWVDDFVPYFSASNNYVHSVVSHGYPPTPVFYGPYFDSNNIGALYNAACTY